MHAVHKCAYTVISTLLEKRPVEKKNWYDQLPPAKTLAEMVKLVGHLCQLVNAGGKENNSKAISNHIES